MLKVIKSIYLWFDSSGDLPNLQNKTKIDWLRCSPFILLHVFCFAVFFVKFEWSLLLVLLITYVLRVFSLTAFYHRFFSHRAFKTSRVMQFIFAFIGTTATQRGPLWWAAHHRHHHKHTDRALDRHSPHVHGFLWSHCGWFLSAENFKTDLSYIKDLSKFPELRFLDRYDIVPPIILAVTLYWFGGWPYVVWGYFISTVLIYHVTFAINSLGHTVGTQSFKTADHSRNNWLLAIFAFGEGWHNNHHHCPSSARQGRTLWQLDISYLILKLMEKFKLVWDLREFDVKENQV